MSAVVWLVVLSASLAVALGKDTLVYSVTYRDVLSSHCLNETEYVDAWEFTPSYGGVADSVYNPSVNISGLTGNSPGQFQPSQLHGNSDRNKILLSEYCPYFVGLFARTKVPAEYTKLTSSTSNRTSCATSR